MSKTLTVHMTTTSRVGKVWVDDADSYLTHADGSLEIVKNDGSDPARFAPGQWACVGVQSESQQAKVSVESSEPQHASGFTDEKGNPVPAWESAWMLNAAGLPTYVPTALRGHRDALLSAKAKVSGAMACYEQALVDCDVADQAYVKAERGLLAKRSA